MHLALTDLFRVRWSVQIQVEWISSVLRARPDLKLEQLKRTRSLMDAHIRDCVVTGYEDLKEGLTLPDPDDRHVFAAPIRWLDPSGRDWRNGRPRREDLWEGTGGSTERHSPNASGMQHQRKCPCS